MLTIVFLFIFVLHRKGNAVIKKYNVEKFTFKIVVGNYKGF